MSVPQLNKTLRIANSALQEQGRGFYLCFGGTFGDGKVFDRGVEHLFSGGTLIYPVCLKNSYWSHGQMRNDFVAFDALNRKIIPPNEVCVFLADGPAQHTFKAIGKSEVEARKITKRGVQQLKQGIDHAMNAVARNSTITKYTVTDWQNISSNSAWIEERTKLERLYHDNPLFKADVERLTRKVLEAQLQEQKDGNLRVTDMLNVGKNYTLDEIAFVAAVPHMLNADKICFTYHKDWEVFRNWADGIYDGDVKSHIGFVASVAVKSSSYGPKTPVIVPVETVARLAKLQSEWNSQKPKGMQVPHVELQSHRPVAFSGMISVKPANRTLVRAA